MIAASAIGWSDGNCRLLTIHQTVRSPALQFDRGDLTCWNRDYPTPTFSMHQIFYFDELVRNIPNELRSSLNAASEIWNIPRTSPNDSWTLRDCDFLARLFRCTHYTLSYHLDVLHSGFHPPKRSGTTIVCIRLEVLNSISSTSPPRLITSHSTMALGCGIRHWTLRRPSFLSEYRLGLLPR